MIENGLLRTTKKIYAGLFGQGTAKIESTIRSLGLYTMLQENEMGLYSGCSDDFLKKEIRKIQRKISDLGC